MSRSISWILSSIWKRRWGVIFTGEAFGETFTEGLGDLSLFFLAEKEGESRICSRLVMKAALPTFLVNFGEVAY